MKFLIVDDIAAEREAVCRQLQQSFDAECVPVSQPEDLESAAAQGGVDLVLTNFQLEWTSGLDILHFTQERFDNVPVVMLADVDNEEVALKGIESGLSDYVLREHLNRLPTTIAASLKVATLRRDCEQAIRQAQQSEDRFRTIAGMMSDYAYVRSMAPDGTGKFEWTYGSFEEITGYTPQELDARGGWRTLLTEEDRPQLEEYRARLLSGQSVTHKFRIITRQGEVRWMRVFAHPEWDEQQGRVVRIYGGAQDITAHYLANQALQQSRDELEMRVRERTAALAQANEALQAEVEGRRRGEKEREHLLLRQNRLLEQIEQDRQRLEVLAQVAQQANSTLRVLIDTMPSGVLGVDPKGTILLTNPAAHAILDVPVGDNIYLQPRPYTLHDSAGTQIPVNDLPLQRALEHGETTLNREMVVHRSDGATKTILESSRPVRDVKGEIVGAVSAFIDITDRKEAEERARQADLNFRRLVEQSDDGIVIIDNRGRIVEWNRGEEEITGIRRDEALGAFIWDIQFRVSIEEHRTAADYERLKAMMEDLSSIDSLPWLNRLVEQQVQRPDGSRRTVQLITFPLDGERSLLIGSITRDVTERKEAEKVLAERSRQLEARNEELAAFAHTVAHDIKNTLAPIAGFADILERGYKEIPEEQVQEYLSFIARSGRKMWKVIDELMLLAEVREKEVEMGPLEMGSVFAEARERLALAIGKAHAEISVPEQWPPAWGYGPWVEEVWINYLSNALKYGGRPPRVEVGGVEQPDGMVRFWMHDNGPGLSAEEAERLFVPFGQVRRLPKEGAGLGLSIVRRIVEKLGGQVGVESQEGQGCTFWFTLPRGKS